VSLLSVISPAVHPMVMCREQTNATDILQFKYYQTTNSLTQANITRQLQLYITHEWRGESNGNHARTHTRARARTHTHCRCVVLLFVKFMLLIPCIFINQYINQQMHLIKHSSWKVSKSYMFRHRSAILRESCRRKEYWNDITPPYRIRFTRPI